MLDQTTAAPTAQVLGPTLRIGYDRQHHRIQIVTDRRQPEAQPTDEHFHCWKWGRDKWYHVPFLDSEKDFDNLCRLLAEVTGARLEETRRTSHGQSVLLRDWPMGPLPAGTKFTFYLANKWMTVERPGFNRMPPIHSAYFLNSDQAFQDWCIMFSKMCGLAIQPKPDKHPSNVITFI